MPLPALGPDAHDETINAWLHRWKEEYAQKESTLNEFQERCRRGCPTPDGLGGRLSEQ